MDSKTKTDKGISPDILGTNSKRTLQAFDQLSKNLNYEIQQFVEENYDSKNISEKWDKHVKEFGYLERYQKKLEEISKKCEDGLKKISDELINELKPSSDSKTITDVEFDHVTPWEKYIKIPVPNLLNFVSAKGWAEKIVVNSGATSFSSLFESKETKIRNAKDKLYKQLTEVGFKMLQTINTQTRDILTKQMLKNIDEFSNIIAGYALMLARIAEAQGKIGETFIEEYSDLNSIIFDEASIYKSGSGIPNILATMRIPGEISIAITETFYIDAKAISELLEEKFVVIEPLSNWEKTMKKILECDFKIDTYQLEFETDNKAYSITPQDKVDATRLKLAQQISPYPIMD